MCPGAGTPLASASVRLSCSPAPRLAWGLSLALLSCRALHEEQIEQRLLQSRLRLADIRLPRSGARELWAVVDPPGAQAATRETTREELSALAAAEEERFTPKSAWFARATLSGTMVPYQTYFTVGLSMGIREWLGYFLLVGAGPSMEWSLFAAPTLVGVTVRAELSLWGDELAARFNLPAASFVMSVMPLVALGDGPEPAFGARATLGVQLTRPQSQWIPLGLDFGYQVWADPAPTSPGPASRSPSASKPSIYEASGTFLRLPRCARVFPVQHLSSSHQGARMPSRVTSTSVRTPSAPQSVPSEVTVASGDSLGKIAKRMGVSVSALVQANVGRYPGLAQNQNAIQVGWKLSAPGAQAASGPTQAATATAGWQGSAATQRAGTTGGVTRPNDLGNKLAAAGAQSIAMRMKAHSDSIDKTGIGLYYGDHSYFKGMDAEAKKAWLKENTKADATTPAMPKESSCIGWAMENVGAAYKAAGKSERWSEIMRTVTAKGSKGIDLAKELQKDGWQAIYWNPDAKHPDDSNPEHTFSAAQVARGNGYYGLKITDKVQNYRPTEGQGTKQDTSGIEKLSKVPFFFGMAKGGMHTFVGRQGNVNEFHWSEDPASHHAIQETPLKDWGWNSGVIMVPPGTWPAN